MAKLCLMGPEDGCEFDGITVFAGAASRRFGWWCCRCIGHIVLLGTCEDVEVRLFEAKRPQRRGELKDRGDGEKGVQYQDRRGIMAHGKLQGHADQSHREGLAWRCVCLVLS